MLRTNRLKTNRASPSLLLVCVVLCCLSSGNPRASQGNCEDAVTTAEMQRCASQRYQTADARLNRVYRRLLSQLPSERRAKLRTAQRAWMEFRDKHLDFVVSSVEGGTMAPVLSLSEKAAMTERRAKELEGWLE